MSKVRKSKLLDSYNLLMKLRPNIIRVRFLPIKASFLVQGVVPPPSIFFSCAATQYVLLCVCCVSVVCLSSVFDMKHLSLSL